MNFYEFMFGHKSPVEAWPQADDRFSDDVIDGTLICLDRVAKYKILEKQRNTLGLKPFDKKDLK